MATVLTSIERIDRNLAVYYQQRQKVYYSKDDDDDSNQQGLFRKYCTDEGYGSEDVADELGDGNEADCGLLDFDEEFPFEAEFLKSEDFNDEDKKREKIFQLLQQFLRDDPPKKSAPTKPEPEQSTTAPAVTPEPAATPDPVTSSETDNGSNPKTVASTETTIESIVAS